MRRAGLLVLFVLLVAWVAVGTGEARLNAGGDLDVVTINVGSGDAVLVEFPKGKRVLVDGGDRVEQGKPDPLIEFLCAAYGEPARLDAVVATHPDQDHVSGIQRLLVSKRVKVGRLLHNGMAILKASTRTRISYTTVDDLFALDAPLYGGRFAELLKTVLDARSWGLPSAQRLCAGGEILPAADLQPVTAQVIAPLAGPLRNYGSTDEGEVKNADSIIIKLSWEEYDVLLAGDVNDLSQPALPRDELRAELLKVPHHGSQHYTEGFYGWVRPTVALITCPPGTHRHPYAKCVKAIGKSMRTAAGLPEARKRIIAVGTRGNSDARSGFRRWSASSAEVSYSPVTHYMTFTRLTLAKGDTPNSMRLVRTAAGGCNAALSAQ